ncbi:Protein of unknown function [Bacillus cereus]|nr:Protein of unknown function [Bacillus cereus]
MKTQAVLYNPGQVAEEIQYLCSQWRIE